MNIIKQSDFVASIAEALQFISYYHPKDFLHAMGRAYRLEKSPAAKDAIAQIITNSRLCAQGHRPICQDTGMVVAFVDVGMQVRWDMDIDPTLDISALVNLGVAQAYTHPDNPLRASMVADPLGTRINTKNNTPAVTHVNLVAGECVEVSIAAKGGGSENKAQFTTLNPNDSLVDWVVQTVPKMGAGWCPPGVLGIGVGGTAEKAMLLAKQSLMQPIDIQKLQQRGANNQLEKLRLELYEKLNNLGIGAQGLGGLTTVLDVKILDYPTHAASLPVAMIPNCAATRHTHFVLDGHGSALFTPPLPEDYPDVTWQPAPQAKKINLQTVTPEQIAGWQAGDTLLLSGKLLTGRDAAHKRIADLIARGEPLPVDFRGRFIYYVGPVDPIAGEIVGPAGPTTATRMDKYTDMMLEKTGILGMIGKAERGNATVNSIRQHRSVYLMAVGGAAYLVAKAIKASKIVAFADLGMEAIYEFEVHDMPVTVGVASDGCSIHEAGPKHWRILPQ